MSGDWLDISGPPEKVGLPAVVAMPDDFAARAMLAEQCWQRLTTNQKMFLSAWRECRYNARAAERTCGISRKTHIYGMHEADYTTVVRVWQANAAASALDKDRLLARQDDIVETLLTPKPILHPGVPTGFDEVVAGAASRANETLMKAAGLLKDKELDVNVGLIGPSFVIQVVQADGTVKDATPRGVTIDLPAVE